MAKTLLDIVQAVAGELLLTVPPAVLASQDRTVKQILALTLAACDELVGMHDWQQLQKTYAFDTEVGVDQYAPPPDYQRYISDTAWDTSNNWVLGGPSTPQNWNASNYGTVYTGPYAKFRLRQNKITLLPVPQSVRTIAIDYISNFYVVDVNTGLTKRVFDNDSDTTLFDDRLLINFVKLKWLQNKGFDTLSVLQDYNSSLEVARGTDTPSASLFMSSSSFDGLIGAHNVPDGNYGA